MTHALGSYSFLPYLRRGISKLVTGADAVSNTALRPSLHVDVLLTGDSISGADQTQNFGKDVHLYGPGDVVGIDRRTIVRMEPRTGNMNAEAPYLAHVDFYDEDFCWRYTPVSPDGQLARLRPWITLVVLADGEFKDGGVPEAKTLPYIEVRDDPQSPLAVKFPPADQLWAWAHVHVNENLTGGETTIVDGDTASVITRLKEVLESDPDLAVSRLICPRKLAPKTKYHAFLIPTFESGRLAGLGLDSGASPSATHSSWAPYTTGQKVRPNRFCYYYRSHFRTGGAGSFESLVRQLVPKPVDSRVGVRDVDLRHPGANIPGIANEPPFNGVLKLGGALKVPDKLLDDVETANRNLYESWDSPYPHLLQTKLAELLNLADDYADVTPVEAHGETDVVGPVETGDCDPVVTPPIYGQWHAMATRLLKERDETPVPNNQNWLHEVNLDPRYRLAAGFGSAIMIREQERFMEASWNQVGAVLEANRKIRLAQLAKQKALSWYEKHIKPLYNVDKVRALQLAAPMQLRVMVQGKTLRGTLKSSLLQPAALSVTTRRAFRPTSRTNRFVPGAKRPQAVFQGIDNGSFKLVPVKQVPSRVPTLQKLTPTPGSTISAALQRAMGISPDRLTTQALESLPKNSNFAVSPVRGAVRRERTTSDSPEATRFKTAMTSAYRMIDASFTAGAMTPKTSLILQQTAMTVFNALDPNQTIPQRLKNRVALPPKVAEEVSDDPMAEAMAYPVIDDPLYKSLVALSPDLFLPNINLLPPNSLTLLESNQPFIEAVSLGACHEWCREALWQEYPTDQRGSPLRQFFDVSDNLATTVGDYDARERLRDIDPIDKWPLQSTLGGHDPGVVGDEDPANRRDDLVLAIRGDLLARYPTAVILAQRAKWQLKNGSIDKSQERQLVEPSPEQEDNPPPEIIRTPIYEARVEPDIYFFGFNLTEDEVMGENPKDDPGWFFVIKERPGEPRYGLDDGAADNPEVWNDLTWAKIQPAAAGSFIEITTATTEIAVQSNVLESDDHQEKLEQRADDESVRWRATMNSADVAYILYQAPVLMAVHASEMLRRK